MPVPAPIVKGQVFQTFDDFLKAKAKYEVEKNVVWVTKTSCSIKALNVARIAAGQNPLPSALVHKYVTYSCKFGGPQRIKTGDGRRPHQSTWKVGCPALMKLTASAKGLVVMDLKEGHQNHDCTIEEMDVIPENRKVHPDDEQLVKTLTEARVKPGRVRPILRESKSPRITARDIANKRAKEKREERNKRTDEQMLKDTLAEIVEADPGASVETLKDSDGNLEMLFVQTSRMKENVQNYGSVILMDHTYKINKNNMPVTILMVMDGNGLGRVVGLAYITNEEKVTVKSVLQAFKAPLSDEVTDTIKTFVIDKCYSEAGAISEVFPNVNIQLCDFHVAKTFTQRSAKEAKPVRKILDELRFCSEDETFNELCERLKEEASVTFFDYFETNWKNCPLAWSFRNKKVAPNLGNTTNNRLENFNSKIKMVIDVDFSLNESLREFMKLIKNREDDARFTHIMTYYKQQYLTSGDDPEIETMMNEVTKFAADLILWEKEEAATAVLKPATTDISCECSHFINYIGLPCRHILKCRLDNGLPWYEPSTYHPRWKLHNPSEQRSRPVSPGTYDSRTVPAKTVPKTSAQKFIKAMSQCRKMANIMAASGDTQFSIRHKVLIG